MASVTTNAPVAAGLFDGVGRFLTAYVQRRRQYGLYRATLRELGALNERELSDLGMSRSEIQAIAWECAYGK